MANPYRSVSQWEPISYVYQIHLQFRGKVVPRWSKWAFVVLVPVVVALLAALMRQTLQAISQAQLRHVLEAIDKRYADNDTHSLLLNVLCMASMTAVSLSLSIFTSRYFAREATGRGMTSVVAHLNGIEMKPWGSVQHVLVKYVTSTLTVASNVPLGHWGMLAEVGAMVGAAVLHKKTSVLLRLRFLKHFRNPRDQSLIVNVGLAAGVASAFHSPVGGLLVMLELLTSRFSVKFSSYVFTGCVIAAFVTQVTATYLDGFTVREEGVDEKTVMAASAEQVQAELSYTLAVPTAIIAIVASVLGSLYSAITVILARVLHNPEDFRVRRGTIAAAIGVAAFYASLNVFLAYSFGGDSCGRLHRASIEIPPAEVGGRSSDLLSAPMSLGTTTNVFCRDKTRVVSFGLSPNQTVNAYASLSLTHPESAFRMLIQREAVFPVGPLLAFFPVLFAASCYFSSLIRVVNGDTILPTGVMGAVLGQLGYHAMVSASTSFQQPWVNAGVFGLIGAAAFMGAASHLTFSLCYLLVDLSGDVRHVAFVLFAIALARGISKHLLRRDSLEHALLRIIGVPLLDFADKLANKDDLTLHRFQTPNLQCLKTSETVGSLAQLLDRTGHTNFPVVDHEGCLVGVLSRSTIERLLWRFTDVVPPEHRFAHLAPNVKTTTASPKASTTGISPVDRWKPTTLKSRRSGASLAQAHESVQAAPPTLASVGSMSSFGSFKMTTSVDYGTREPGSAEGYGGTGDGTVSAGVDDYDVMRDVDTWVALHTRVGTRPVYGPAPATVSPAARVNQPLVARPGPTTNGKRGPTNTGSTHVVVGTTEMPTLTEAIQALPRTTFDIPVNVARYTDRSVFTVRIESSAGRAYQLFNVMGASFLIIVCYEGRPRGILSRVDLLHPAFETKRAAETWARRDDAEIPSDTDDGASTLDPEESRLLHHRPTTASPRRGRGPSASSPSSPHAVQKAYPAAARFDRAAGAMPTSPLELERHSSWVAPPRGGEDDEEEAGGGGGGDEFAANTFVSYRNTEWKENAFTCDLATSLPPALQHTSARQALPSDPHFSPSASLRRSTAAGVGARVIDVDGMTTVERRAFFMPPGCTRRRLKGGAVVVRLPGGGARPSATVHSLEATVNLSASAPVPVSSTDDGEADPLGDSLGAGSPILRLQRSHPPP